MRRKQEAMMNSETWRAATRKPNAFYQGEVSAVRLAQHCRKRRRLVGRCQALHQVLATTTCQQACITPRDNTRRMDSPVHSRVLLSLHVVISPRDRVNSTITICKREQEHSTQTSALHCPKNLQVGIAKVRDAVPARVHVLLRGLWRLDDAVLGALDSIVRPPCQEIGCVHDNGVFDRRGVDESALGRQDLQAAGHVLEQKRDGAVVRMRSSPHSPLVLLELACWAGRVVQKSTTMR